MNSLSIDPDHVGYTAEQLRDTAARAVERATADDAYSSVRISQRNYAQACNVQAALMQVLGLATVPDCSNLAEDDHLGHAFAHVLALLDEQWFHDLYTPDPHDGEGVRLADHLRYVATVAGVKAREAARLGEHPASHGAQEWSATARDALASLESLRSLDAPTEMEAADRAEIGEALRALDHAREILSSHESAFVLLRRMRVLFDDSAPGTIGQKLQRQIADVLVEAGQEQGPEGDA